VNYDEKIYEGVGHAFMCPDKEKYNAEVAKIAFDEGVAWIKSKLGIWLWIF